MSNGSASSADPNDFWDEDGQIYIIVNENGDPVTPVQLYILTRRTRRKPIRGEEVVYKAFHRDKFRPYYDLKKGAQVVQKEQNRRSQYKRKNQQIQKSLGLEGKQLMPFISQSKSLTFTRIALLLTHIRINLHQKKKTRILCLLSSSTCLKRSFLKDNWEKGKSLCLHTEVFQLPACSLEELNTSARIPTFGSE